MIDPSLINGRVDRADYDVVISLAPEGSKVLDLGCGDGELLLRLTREKNCRVSGVEIDKDLAQKSIRKGVCVLEADIDEGLVDYPDSSFDVVLLSQTIQVTRQPHLVLREMLRVGKHGIVSAPNFAHWLARFQLGVLGKMPHTKELPFEWYETPNIHLVTINDFRRFCRDEGIKIEREIFLGTGRRKITFLSNLLARTAIWSLRKA